MNIYVLMKRTFDTEEEIVIHDNQIEQSRAEFIINPYDEYAIEEAIVLKEKHGGEVVVVSVGEEETEKELRQALAMGADKAVLIDAEDLESQDQGVTATLLAAYLQTQEPDVILAGNIAIDGGSGQVGPRVAAILDLPQVTAAIQIEIEQNQATIVRDVEGDEETIRAALPLLITAQQGLNEPRYPTLPGIMKAKKKPLVTIDLDEIGIDAAQLTTLIETKSIFLPPPKQAGKQLTGDLNEQVKELVRLIKLEEI